MKVMIVLGFVLFCLSALAAYLLLYFPSRWLSWKGGLRLWVSFFLALAITSFYLFVSPVRNSFSATIQKQGDDYHLTIIGKLSLMHHDPISFLKRRTVWDTLQLNLPRQDGVIKGEEIPTRAGYYRLAGTVTIQDKKMKVDLFYVHPDQSQSPVALNGVYDLK